jgi:hypothetical protein
VICSLKGIAKYVTEKKLPYSGQAYICVWHAWLLKVIISEVIQISVRHHFKNLVYSGQACICVCMGHARLLNVTVILR